MLNNRKFCRSKSCWWIWTLAFPKLISQSRWLPAKLTSYTPTIFKDILSHILQKFMNSEVSQLLVRPTIFQTILIMWLHSSLTLSQTSSGFYMSEMQVFWKHNGKTINCSLQAISPFSTVFFYLFGELSAIFIKFEIAVCKLFQVGRVLRFIVWKRVKKGRKH